MLVHGNNNHSNIYRQTFNIRRTFEGNKIDVHSDVVGASPVGAAPSTSSTSTFSTWHLTSMFGQRQWEDETRNIWIFWFGASYTRGLTVECEQRGKDICHLLYCVYERIPQVSYLRSELGILSWNEFQNKEISMFKCCYSLQEFFHLIFNNHIP